MGVALQQFVQVRLMHRQLADMQEPNQLVPAIVGNDVETLGRRRDAGDQAEVRHAGESNLAHDILLFETLAFPA